MGGKRGFEGKFSGGHSPCTTRNVRGMSEEKHVWSGTPSQVINLGSYLLLGLFFWLVIPLFVALWKWLVVKNTKYELTTERLRTSNGVLNRKTDELELYRVQDYRLEQPFFLRLFSLGNVVLSTYDHSHPQVVLKAVPNSEALLEQVRACVEVVRGRKGVREITVE